MHYVSELTLFDTCIIMHQINEIKEQTDKLFVFFCKHFKKFTKFNKHFCQKDIKIAPIKRGNISQ